MVCIQNFKFHIPQFFLLATPRPTNPYANGNDVPGGGVAIRNDGTIFVSKGTGVINSLLVLLLFLVSCRKVLMRRQ